MSDAPSSRSPLAVIPTMAWRAVKPRQETNHTGSSPFSNSRSKVKVPTGDGVRCSGGSQQDVIFSP